MPLLVYGINHTTASLDVREQVAFVPEQLAEAHCSLLERKGIDGAVILSTCNRTELVVSGESASQALVGDWLCDFHQLAAIDLEACVYCHEAADAVEHLIRVAAGLDSLVMGEPQIFGQMKSAYACAEDARTVSAELGQLFPHVFAVAKRVRTDTAIGQNPVSVAFAAVSLTQHIFADLGDCRALLIGAGETIELAARHLKEKGVAGLTIANRTLDRAAALAREHGGKAIMLSDIPEQLARHDIVIASTASQLPILGKGSVEQAMKKRKHRPVLMVDIAVPRDIEAQVGDLDDVYLYTLDDLHDIVEENRRARVDEADKAAVIIAEGLESWSQKQNLRDASNAVVELRGRADELRQQELEKAMRNLGNGTDPEHVLETLARNLTNKLMHQPSVSLREAAAAGDQDTLTLARKIFDLDASDGNTE